MTDRKREDLDQEPTGVMSEHTMDNAHPEDLPAHAPGGPPKHDDLSVSPSMMGRRALEDATGAPGREMIQDPNEPIDPDTLPA